MGSMNELDNKTDKEQNPSLLKNKLLPKLHWFLKNVVPLRITLLLPATLSAPNAHISPAVAEPACEPNTEKTEIMAKCDKGACEENTYKPEIAELLNRELPISTEPHKTSEPPTNPCLTPNAPNAKNYNSQKTL